MTDAHCHLRGVASRHFLCESFGEMLAPAAGDRVFYGLHPWYAASPGAAAVLDSLRSRLEAAPLAGVGEIGLDRLKAREIPAVMREVFERQLALAAELGRNVVLHGAKCWGEVVKTVARFATRDQKFLFHGFSRADGLLREIVALNGYFTVTPAVLNDHAVNYRELVCRIPAERLLVESDRTAENAAELPRLEAVVEKLAELRGVSAAALAETLERNADDFIAESPTHRQEQ